MIPRPMTDLVPNNGGHEGWYRKRGNVIMIGDMEEGYMPRYHFSLNLTPKFDE